MGGTFYISYQTQHPMKLPTPYHLDFFVIDPFSLQKYFNIAISGRSYLYTAGCLVDLGSHTDHHHRKVPVGGVSMA